MKIIEIRSNKYSPRPGVKKHSGGPGIRPLVWKSGPDPVLHQQYAAWSQCRAQANYRGEAWQLTFEEYQEIWQGSWHLRGRTKNTLCMSRLDSELPWDRSNSQLITRREHNLRQVANRRRHGPRPREQRQLEAK